MGAQALIESVKQLLLTNCRAEIVLSGVPLQVTPDAKFVKDGLELEFSVIPADEEDGYPVVIIYNKFKGNIPNSRQDFETHPGWTWSASIQSRGGNSISENTYLSSALDISGNTYHNSCLVKMGRRPVMDSCHGEGETSMQYQMCQCTSFGP